MKDITKTKNTIIGTKLEKQSKQSRELRTCSLSNKKEIPGAQV
jgi:hypothetical protein